MTQDFEQEGAGAKQERTSAGTTQPEKIFNLG